MDKKQAREKIKILVEKYGSLSDAEKKKYNESMICKDFVLPLFQALGWDVYNNSSHEVTSEAQISGKRADYAFYVNDIIKFFVEAKKPSVDLREEKVAEQAVFYAWHKSVPWAILTNFEVIKVFNAEWDETDVERSLIFEINFTDFLEDKRLWWLSKESMGKGELDKYAQENFKKPKREPVDKQLASDLVRWRTVLFNDLKQWNRGKEYTEKIIAKAVQQLLDRFIFIRTTEDRQIEGERLRELVRNYEENKGKISLGGELKKLFASYNKDYDSRLFEFSGCDKLEYEDSLFADIIKQLYKNIKGIRYDFSSINADVLGSIYEQYLGQIQESEKNKSKRKSQGIYYTPRYIVDYIVRNTLGELLKGKSGQEAAKLKILDPACGSGSFLIKAFEVLDKHIKRENDQLNAQKFVNYARKVAILTSNIYGVDLDEEAVEIAQLNLLLKVLEQKELLPNLGHNIENGNSLISGAPKELEKYFGKDWKNKKPFNWEERFSDVFKQGGFDVIIGNPPYIRPHKLDDDFKKYAWDHYGVFKAKSDIYAIFMQKAIDLLREGGILSFIVSSTWLSLESFGELRKYILDKCSILSLTLLPSKVFENATVETMIFSLRREKNKIKRNNNIVVIYQLIDNKFIKVKEIKQLHFLTTHLNIFSFSESRLLDKISKLSEPLEDLIEFHYGLKTGDDDKFLAKKHTSSDHKKLLRRSDFSRYSINYHNEYVWYVPELMRKNKITARPGDKERFESPKIIIQDINKRLVASFDDDNYYIKDALMLLQKNDKSLKYILALINSKLLNFYYSQQFKTLSVAKNAFLALPIYNLDLSVKKEKNRHDELAVLADKMLKLNKELKEIDPILDKEEFEEKKAEIEKTDREIDQKVYALYGLTEEEVRMVEGGK